MKIINILTIIGLVPILFSCENELPIANEGSHGLVINALAATDSVLSISVTDAYRYDEVEIYSPYFYLEFDRYLRKPKPESDIYIDKFNNSEATVTAVVNGEKLNTIYYNEATKFYKSDYIPKPGDNIEISVTAPNRELVRAKVTIPDYQPEVELLGIEKRYEPYDRTSYYTDYENDSVYYLTLKLRDRVEVQDYYRLKVRKSYFNLEVPEELFIPSDSYSSDDELFYDPYMINGYGGWPANFSTVFTDEKFINGEYTVTVAVRDYKYFSHLGLAFIIEQQSIPKDYYYYIKSFQLYRSFEPDEYSELIRINSNCSNGIGIFGAVSSKKLRINVD